MSAPVRTVAAVPTVITDLILEWEALIRQGSFADQLDAWLEAYPCLRDAITPTDAVVDRSEQDEAFHALLSAHRAGSYAAGRLVLQCMLPAIRKMVARGGHRYGSGHEAAADATAAMWTAIATHDLDRPSKVVSRLWSRALDAFTRPNGRAATIVEVAASDAMIESVANSRTRLAGSSADAQHLLGATGEVLEVLAWGLDNGIIRPEEAALLTRLYAPDPDLPEYETLVDTTATDRSGRPRPHSRFQSRVADELGLSHDVVRQRASRAVRRLAEGVQAAL
ncbi:hypothetical protein [Promicromonospora sp. NFX87]|uniref:hypothetical protein n=1 Tax=Promicromonospora sp. NFX87 TaxID=3402691 RepID=UPI003AFAECDC